MRRVISGDASLGRVEPALSALAMLRRCPKIETALERIGAPCAPPELADQQPDNSIGNVPLVSFGLTGVDVCHVASMKGSPVSMPRPRNHSYSINQPHASAIAVPVTLWAHHPVVYLPVGYPSLARQLSARSTRLKITGTCGGPAKQCCTYAGRTLARHLDALSFRATFVFSYLR